MIFITARFSVSSVWKPIRINSTATSSIVYEAHWFAIFIKLTSSGVRPWQQRNTLTFIETGSIGFNDICWFVIIIPMYLSKFISKAYITLTIMSSAKVIIMATKLRIWIIVGTFVRWIHLTPCVMKVIVDFIWIALIPIFIQFCTCSTLMPFFTNPV